MKMADWVERLNAFLQFNGFEVLDNPGKVSTEVAKKLAEEQYEKFRVKQDTDFESDFEREVKRLEGEQNGRRGPVRWTFAGRTSALRAQGCLGMNRLETSIQSWLGICLQSFKTKMPTGMPSTSGCEGLLRSF